MTSFRRRATKVIVAVVVMCLVVGGTPLPAAYAATYEMNTEGAAAGGQDATGDAAGTGAPGAADAADGEPSTGDGSSAENGSEGGTDTDGAAAEGPSANGSTAEGSAAEGIVSTENVASSDTETKGVANGVALVAEVTGDEAAVAEEEQPKSHDVDAARTAVLGYLQQSVTNPIVSSAGGEWAVIAMARAGVLPEETKNAWLGNLYQKLDETNGVLNDKYYTEYSRVALALSAIGVDPTNVNGYNLLVPLADFDQVNWQGVNGTIWALLALDSGNYDIPELPENATGTTQTTRLGLLTKILDNQSANGSWGWTSEWSPVDVDTTSMAIQALAPYYGTDAGVKRAVDRGLDALKSAQKETGAFGSGSGNPSSMEEVVIALSVLDPNLLTSGRFAEGERTVLDCLLDFQLADGSFTFMLGDYASPNPMATEHGAMALVACNRALTGQTSFFDMTDTAYKGDDEEQAPAESVAAFKAKLDALPSVGDCRIRHREDVRALMAELDGMGAFDEKEAFRAELQVRLDAIDEQVAVVDALDNDIWSQIDPNNVTLADAEAVRALMARYEALPVENRRFVELAEDLISAQATIERLEEEQAKQEEQDKQNQNKQETSDSITNSTGAGGQNSPLNAAQGIVSGGAAATRSSLQGTARSSKTSFAYELDEGGNMVVTSQDGIATRAMLEAIAGKDQNLVLAFDTDMGACRVTVNGLDLSGVTLTDIDFSLSLGSSDEEAIAQLAEDPLVFSFKNAGAFIAPVMVELPVDLVDGDYLLLSYDAGAGALSFVQKVAASGGIAKFVVDHGGTYVLATHANTETQVAATYRSLDTGVAAVSGLEGQMPGVAAGLVGGAVVTGGVVFVMDRRKRVVR